MEKFLAVVLGLALIISFDHGMRLDQQQSCSVNADVSCPTSLWFFGLFE